MPPFRLLAAATVSIFVLLAALACQSRATSENGSDVASESTPIVEVSREISVLAHRLVFAYMSDKPWGFFGATCEQWIREDYQWESSMSQQLDDDRVKVTYKRNEDRILGPEVLAFYVDIDTKEVEGDNEPDTDTGRIGVAEGCDQW